MTVDLETRLRSIADALDTAVERYNDHDLYVARPATSHRRLAIVGIAVLVAAAAAGGIALLASKSTPSDSVTGSQLLTPTATLPHNDDASDRPVIGLGSQPHLWYRLKPDLEVTWYTDGRVPVATSMLCWRTPVRGQCVPGVFGSGPLPMILPAGGGQTLVVTRGDVSAKTLHVRLADGRTLTAPITWDTYLNWGVARYEVPSGAAITQIGTRVVQTADTVAIGPTLPPTVDQHGPASTWPTNDPTAP